MNQITEDRILEKGTGETVIVSISFVNWLDEGETISGTPTAAASGLTISDVAANAVPITVKSKAVPTLKGIQMKVAGGTLDTTYSVLVTFSTSAGATRTYYFPMRIVGQG